MQAAGAEEAGLLRTGRRDNSVEALSAASSVSQGRPAVASRRCMFGLLSCAALAVSGKLFHWQAIFEAREGEEDDRGAGAAAEGIDGVSLDLWDSDAHLVSWEAAHARALRVVAELTAQQTYRLLRGSGGAFVGNTLAIPEHGIPSLKMQDAGNGFRMTEPGLQGTTTQWPCNLALASTWDEALVHSVAAAIGAEFRGKGANVLLGPGVNVHRTALGGRNFEYLSGEDPYLGARLTETYIRAVQGQGVMAVVKHFAFNEQETNRMIESSSVDRRTAWELYYPPFEAAVRAGAGAVMCAYNKVNGTPACGSAELLRRDLKAGMGFRGFVMSDWGATHASNSVTQGLDMEMPTGQFLTDSALNQAGNHWAVNEAANRVLAAIYHVGLDVRPGCVEPCLKELRSNQRTRAHVELARRAATMSVTLLKNDGTLPLNPSRVRTIAVLGVASNVREDAHMDMWKGSVYAGGGSGHVISPHEVTPLQGIKERAAEAGVRVLHYAGSNHTYAKLVAARAEVAIVVGGAHASEGSDRQILFMAWNAESLIKMVATIRPVVVLTETPGPILTPWRSKAAAVLNLFHGGEQTGKAWASVLFGDVSPAGKLPVTFPASEMDTIWPSGKPVVRYTEKLSTGYRSSHVKAAYAFGHGLSYTTFAYASPKVETSGKCTGVLCIVMSVRNDGNRYSGAEVVQAYLRFPQAAAEPAQVLRGFSRTPVLSPGQSVEVRLVFAGRDLSFFRVGVGWVRPCSLQVHLGSSNVDIRHEISLKFRKHGSANCAVVDRWTSKEAEVKKSLFDHLSLKAFFRR